MNAHTARPPKTSRSARRAWDAAAKHCASLSGDQPKVEEIFSGRESGEPVWYFSALSDAAREKGSPYFQLDGHVSKIGKVASEWTSARGSWG